MATGSLMAAFPILFDKLELWTRATREGNMEMRDYNRRAMVELENALAAVASLRAILPYAESRAEDMQENADKHASLARSMPRGLPFDNTGPAELARDACAAAEKAVAAVDAAKALLASLDATGAA